MNRSEQINELAAALSLAQGEMEGAAKGATNPHFKSKYADLASIWDAVRAPLSKHGLSVVQLPEEIDGKVRLATMILHKSGQWIEASYALSPVKGDPQGYGSALTYMRRYALTGVGVAPEEDDGNAASAKHGTHGNGEAITAAQRDRLLALLTEKGRTPDSFCAYYKIESIPDLPQSKFDEAVKLLSRPAPAKQNVKEAAE